MKAEKAANKKKAKKQSAGLQATQVNSSKKFIVLGVLTLVTAAGIFGVWNIGKKAEATVSVVVLKDGAYRNQMITEDMLVEYPMIQAEYEKAAYVTGNAGQKVNRYFKWEERGNALGYYAAYPILSETPLEKRQLIASRIDNSDTVLYSFPGKDIIQLEVGTSALSAFKTFLQPGDKLNIEALYTDTIEVEKPDGYGGVTKEEVEVLRTETAFGNIMIADLINGSGNSVLDIYTNYNQMDEFQKAALEQDSSWQESVTPSSLLVALSPKEKELYYKYLAKDNIQFRVSLPQRTQ